MSPKHRRALALLLAERIEASIVAPLAGMMPAEIVAEALTEVAAALLRTCDVSRAQWLDTAARAYDLGADAEAHEAKLAATDACAASAALAGLRVAK